MNSEEIGYVTRIRNFLAYLSGFPTIRINDLIQSDNGLRGWVNSIAGSEIEALMLDEGPVKPGQEFKKISNRLSLPVGDFLISRSINPLGIPIDGKGLLFKRIKSFNIQNWNNPHPG